MVGRTLGRAPCGAIQRGGHEAAPEVPFSGSGRGVPLPLSLGIGPDLWSLQAFRATPDHDFPPECCQTSSLSESSPVCGDREWIVGQGVAEDHCLSPRLLAPLQLHVAEHPAGHLVLKWLIEQDKKMKESGREGRL